MSPEELELIADTREVLIETSRDGRPFRTIIWIVVVDDEVYVRSVRGDGGKWYQRAVANPEVVIIADRAIVSFRAISATEDDTVAAVSAAIAAKYPTSQGSVDAMNDPAVLHTTLRLEPIG